MSAQLNFFHNTIALNSVEIHEREHKVIHQTEVIEMFFRKYPERDFTPCEIYELLEHRILLTSVQHGN